MESICRLPGALGEFEHPVLLAILREDGQAYGFSVREEIKMMRLFNP